MTQRHKHADLIIAWANGAKIQYLNKVLNAWRDCSDPGWLENYDYRIKPEPKPDLIRYGVCRIDLCRKTAVIDCLGPYNGNKDNVKLTLDGETNKLKSVEVL